MTRFRKVHYEALAKVLRDARQDVRLYTETSSLRATEEGVEIVQGVLMEMLGWDNPGFSELKFSIAATLGSEPSDA